MHFQWCRVRKHQKTVSFTKPRYLVLWRGQQKKKRQLEVSWWVDSAKWICGLNLGQLGPELFGEGTYWLLVSVNPLRIVSIVGVFMFTMFNHVCLSGVISLPPFHPSFFTIIKHFYLTVVSSIVFIRQSHISSSCPHSFAFILPFL